MEENATTIHTLQYLYSIDTCLTEISGVDNILRQNYLQKAKRLEQRDGITLPSKTIKPRVKCPKCSMPRTNGLAEFKLLRNARQNRFLTRLKRKVDEGKLTKYQRRFLKKKNGMLDQVQSIHCNVCKYVVTEPVTKPDFLKTKCEVVVQNKGVTQKKFVKNENKQVGNKQIDNKHGTGNHNSQQNKRTDNKNKGKGNVAKQQSNKNNKRQQNKMQTMLASACKLKSTNLKDFIKSVT